MPKKMFETTNQAQIQRMLKKISKNLTSEAESNYLLASATGAMPETVRFNRTAKSETPPT